jgi:hypothetical protein
MMSSMSSLERVLGRGSRKTYNWLYRVLMPEVGGFVARRCSPNTAHHVATSIGWFLWLLPWNRGVRQRFRRAFPDGPVDPAEVARGWLARPFRDHIMITAHLAGRSGFFHDDARQEMSSTTRSLFESDRSVLIAMSHMCREAITVLSNRVSYRGG